MFNRSVYLLVALALATTLNGCATYRVMRYDGQGRAYRNVPGVPFYVKRAVCRQETVLQQDVRKLTLQIDSFVYNQGGVFLETRRLSPDREAIVSASVLQSGPFVHLRSLIERMSDKDSVLTALERLPAFDPSNWRTERLLLVSNQTAPSQYVDYSNQYYMNVDRPLIGSASVTAKLASDGTLTESTAEVKDETVQSFLSLIPIKEILTSRLIPSTEGGQEFSNFRPTYKYTLLVEATPILHTLARTHVGDAVPCSNQAAIKPHPTDSAYSYTRALASSKAGTAATNPNAINVSGQITMPSKP